MSGRVKLLEWEEPSSATNGCWVGRGSLHWTRHPCEEGYSISHNMSLYSVFVDDGRPGEQQDLGEFENIAAAKAAAQADFERRILAAIEPDATLSPAAEADLEAIQAELAGRVKDCRTRHYSHMTAPVSQVAALLAEVARLRAREAELVEGLRQAVDVFQMLVDPEKFPGVKSMHVWQCCVTAEARARALINGGSDV